jgi:hypothetical protein
MAAEDERRADQGRLAVTSEWGGREPSVDPTLELIIRGPWKRAVTFAEESTVTSLDEG